MNRAPEKKESGTQPAKIKKKKLAACIDLDPQHPRIEESREVPRIDLLIRAGLGEADQIVYYRRAMQDPHSVVTNPVYREMVAEVLDELLEIVFDDQVLFNRVRQNLETKNRKVLREETVSYDRVVQALNRPR